ncbi:MAG: hypothetical protein U0U66_06825 [Cytophagaceae bacterium]
MKIFLFSITFIITLGCQSPYKTTLNPELNRIYFGNGGGFSGKVNQWVLSANGRLYQIVDINKEKDSLILIKKISKKITNQLFEEYSGIEENSKPFQDPNNMYSFIRFENSSKNIIYTWNESTNDIIPLKSLYNKLYEQTL